MSTENVKEIVKEKYGHAALRVTSGDGIPAVVTTVPDRMCPVIRLP